jgi:hypothetical protein
MGSLDKKEIHGAVSLLTLALEKKSTSVEKREKHVRFSNVEIREYALTVGDHPYCPDGLALSLDWGYSPQTTVKSVVLEDTEKQNSLSSPPLRRLGYMDRRMRLRRAAIIHPQQ